MHIQNMKKEHGNHTGFRGSHSCVCGSNAPVNGRQQVEPVAVPHKVSHGCEMTLAIEGKSQWELAIGGNP